MLLENLSLSIVYNAIKDIIKYVIGRKKKMMPEDVILARQRWKEEVENRLGPLHDDQCMEVIIRDSKRIDNYPSTSEKGRRISSWFSVGIIGTYHRGLMVFLKLEGLKYEENKKAWRYCDYINGEDHDINASLIGLIPFERIVSIDWEGDEYYRCPHIYCHFISESKEPYEELIFCQKRVTGQFVDYPEVAKHNDVRKLSKKLKKGNY